MATAPPPPVAVVRPNRFNICAETREDRLPWLEDGVDIARGSSTPRLVIAIDFGTFSTGYALQWRSDFDSDRLKIHCNTKWVAGGFCTYKTPTCLLLRPDTSLADFGYQAEAKFSLLGEDDNEKPEEWYFFRHFKMMLYHREGITDDTPVEAEHGKHLPLIDVFSKSIQYMKDHALNHLQQNGLAYPEAETKWVLTVPAIWDEPSKQVMRRSAEKAGIRGENLSIFLELECAATYCSQIPIAQLEKDENKDNAALYGGMEAGIRGENLSIALEPECAAIYCSQIPVDQLEIEGDKGKLAYVAAPGSTIMVVDMGGGTVDITTVQISNGSTMKQVFMSGGGPWGGMNVDEKFLLMLKDIVGADVMKTFVDNHRIDEFDLRMEFESQKREVKHPLEANANGRFRIKLPSSLKDLWEDSTGKKIVDILRSRPDLKDVKFMSGRLSFLPDVIREFFKQTIDEILRYVTDTLSNPEHEGRTIDSLILVGGFAESNFVVRSIREGLSDRGIPVVRPQSTELAVMNGAVLFGQNEEILTSRILRYTYGVGMVMEYKEDKHDQSQMFEADGKKWANDVFRKHVTRGQEVKLGKWITDKEYYPVDENQNSAQVYIFSSDKMDPVHTTEHGCKFVGKLDIAFSKPPSKENEEQPEKTKAVAVALNFGGTELKIRAVDKTLGKTFKKCLKLH